MNARTAFGLARSILIYHAIPGRIGRLARFYRQFLRPDDLCFDIGAHVGNHIRALLRLGVRVVALEPQPTFARLLRRLYGGQSRVRIIEAAIGAAPGQTEMLVSERKPTVTTLSREWADQVKRARPFAGVEWEHSLMVNVTTLDALIAEYGLPTFCKLDVEGYELEALRGLSQPIPALALEYIPATPDLTLACVDRLSELGRYELNRTVGEAVRFTHNGWLDADAIRADLAGLPVDSRSGNLIARLTNER